MVKFGKFNKPIIGTNRKDKFKGLNDLDLAFGLDNNDIFKPRNGKPPETPGLIEETVGCFGGEGNDKYFVPKNSVLAIADSGKRDRDRILARNVTLQGPTSYSIEIQGPKKRIKHLFAGDLAANQSVFIYNWREPSKKRGILQTADGTFKNQFLWKLAKPGNPGYLGLVSWKEFEAMFGFDFKGTFGIPPNRMEHLYRKLFRFEKRLGKASENDARTKDVLGAIGVQLESSRNDALIGRSREIQQPWEPIPELSSSVVSRLPNDESPFSSYELTPTRTGLTERHDPLQNGLLELGADELQPRGLLSATSLTFENNSL